MRRQTGYVFRAGGAWYGRWRRDELQTITDGSKVVVRRQHCEKLCEYSDRYRAKKDVQPLLDEKLKPLNEGRSSAESTLLVSVYGDEHFLPWAERELKPSTVCGYRGLWKTYLKPRVDSIVLRDFRCVDATNLLATIHRDHKLSRKSLRHCKALMSTIFTHAKRAGVLDGENPIKDAGIPRAASAPQPTHAYSPDEVIQMLDALQGVARTAVALMYFCGLRQGEARAAQWENYDAKRKILRIRGSMWRSHLTDPKTAESVSPVPVAETLAEILAENPGEGFILVSPLGQPIDLHNLSSRVIRPALARCAVCRKAKHATADHEYRPIAIWRGWYSCRRGAATLATSLDSALAAKSLLRHANVATTQQFYIKSVPAEAVRAVERIDALFQKSTNVAPN